MLPIKFSYGPVQDNTPVPRTINRGKYSLTTHSLIMLIRNYNKRSKKNFDKASAIAIVGITPSSGRVKRSRVISKTTIFSAVFLVTWLVDINDFCNLWYAFEDVGEIAKLQGNPKMLRKKKILFSIIKFCFILCINHASEPINV